MNYGKENTYCCCDSQAVSYTNIVECSRGIGTYSGHTLPDGSFRNVGFLLNKS